MSVEERVNKNVRQLMADYYVLKKILQFTSPAPQKCRYLKPQESSHATSALTSRHRGAYLPTASFILTPSKLVI
jgi:hypothetical protein